MSAEPFAYNFVLYRGRHFSRIFRLFADSAKTARVDLTGATLQAEVRALPGGELLATLAATISGAAANGEVLVELDAADAAAIPAEAGRGRWELAIAWTTGEPEVVGIGDVAILQPVVVWP